MRHEIIKQLITQRTKSDGLTPTGMSGVHLFRATQTIPCVPAIYEPSVIAIVSGSKETFLDGHKYVYDQSRYLCCPMSMPVTAGTPNASVDNPLVGVLISLDRQVMTELVLEMENAPNSTFRNTNTPHMQGIRLAQWDEAFSDALLNLLKLGANATDTAILGKSRLRELFYAILKGDAGVFMQQTFGSGNAIARSITHLSTQLDKSISIDDMAKYAGMSRAVFHRRFKQVTTMTPIQFVKSMRLNTAAMKIASGTSITKAALEVGYISPSQFSREFKRMYGQSPRQWSEAPQYTAQMTSSPTL